LKKLHLVMPMGGRGSRFANYDFAYPKPLIEIQNRPFFYWAAQSVCKFMPVADVIFVVLREHVENHHIDRRIREFYPQAIIRVLDEVLAGAVLTSLEGIRAIGDDQPILLNDCDHIFRCDAFNRMGLEGFPEDLDGALLTFPSREPKYSFLEYGRDGYVTRTVEKQVISGDAICGAYYFRNAALFSDAAAEYLHTCQYQEYFISGVYNVMVAAGQKVKGLQTDFHIPFGVPEEYEAAKTSERFGELR